VAEDEQEGMSWTDQSGKVMEGKGEREVTASPRGWVAILLMTVLLSSFFSLLLLLTHLHTFLYVSSLLFFCTLTLIFPDPNYPLIRREERKDLHCTF